MLEHFSAACSEAGLRPRIAHRCSQAITLAGLMAGGSLVTAIYAEDARSMQSPLAEVFVSVPLEMPGPSFQLALFWSRERRLPAAAQQFVTHIRSILAAARHRDRSATASRPGRSRARAAPAEWRRPAGCGWRPGG